MLPMSSDREAESIYIYKIRLLLFSCGGSPLFHVKQWSDNPILYWQRIETMVVLGWSTHYSPGASWVKS